MINTFSESLRQDIDKWLSKFPPERKQSGLLYALRRVQEENGGSLTTELIDQVANYLDIAPSLAYEVATFYSMYYLEPQGQHSFSVCTNISCMLRGSGEIVNHLEERLGIKVGETTKDGRYTLREAECLAACCAAPVLQLDDRDYCENLTPEKIDDLLNTLNNKNKKEKNEGAA